MINLVRNPTEWAPEICCRDHREELQRLVLILEEKPPLIDKSVLRERRALNTHRQNHWKKELRISCMLYQGTESI